MDKNDIINYVMHTPHNTNKAILSDMLNQLTEGGGGGSSDFSTATVTIVNNTSTEIGCDGAWLITGEEGEKLTKPSFSLEGNDSITSTIIIVDLGANIFIHPVLSQETSDALSCTTTGSVEDFGYGTLQATGDCTITLVSI